MLLRPLQPLKSLEIRIQGARMQHRPVYKKQSESECESVSHILDLALFFSSLPHCSSHFFTPTLERHVVTNFSQYVMFYFEKLDVYQKAKAFNSGIRNFINNTTLDSVINNQLRRAAFCVVLNLAEGSGRFV
jgi:hypothetical protein